MRLSKLMRFATVFILVAIVATFVFTACGKSDIQRFYTAYNADVTIYQTDLVAEFRTKATSVLNIKSADAFIEAGYLDNVPFLELHVLTKDQEYKIYKVQTEMNGPIVDMFIGGTSPYDDTAKNYILNAVAKLQDGVIIFSEG